MSNKVNQPNPRITAKFHLPKQIFTFHKIIIIYTLVREFFFKQLDYGNEICVIY